MTPLQERLGELQHCSGCDFDKPRTVEYFYVAVRDEGGGITRLDALCKPCRKAIQRDKYRTKPDWQERHKRAAKEQRARQRKRRRRDPEYDAALRAYGREANRRARERARQAGDSPKLGGPELPVGPLLDVVEPLIEATRAEAVLGDDAEGAVCGLLGITTRTLYRWRAGGKYLYFDVADRAMLALGMELEDVWPVEDLPEWVLASV